MCGCSSRTLADMTEDVREKFESLGISVKDVLQLRSGRRNQEAVQAHPLTPHFIVTSAGTRRGESSLPNRALRIARFHEDVRRPERDPAVQALPTLRPYAAVLWLRSPVCCLWRGSPFRGVLHPTAAAEMLQLRRKPHSQLSGMCEMEGGQGGAC